MWYLLYKNNLSRELKTPESNNFIYSTNICQGPAMPWKWGCTDELTYSCFLSNSSDEVLTEADTSHSTPLAFIWREVIRHPYPQLKPFQSWTTALLSSFSSLLSTCFYLALFFFFFSLLHSLLICPPGKKSGFPYKDGCMLTNVIHSLFLCVQDWLQKNLRFSPVFYATTSWDKGGRGVYTDTHAHMQAHTQHPSTGGFHCSFPEKSFQPHDHPAPPLPRH